MRRLPFAVVLALTAAPAGAGPDLAAQAESGDAAAQYRYATALFNGDRVARDWAKAFAMMTLAARAGYAPAETGLIQMQRYIPLRDRREGVVLADNRAAPEPFAPPVALAVNEKAPPPPPLRLKLDESKPLLLARYELPRPAAVAVAVIPKPVGRWQVQLGAFGDTANARGLWAKLSKLPAMASLEPRYVPAGALTRLRAGPLDSRAAADRICAEAKARGQACFPVSG